MCVCYVYYHLISETKRSYHADELFMDRTGTESYEV